MQYFASRTPILCLGAGVMIALPSPLYALQNETLLSEETLPKVDIITIHDPDLDARYAEMYGEDYDGPREQIFQITVTDTAESGYSPLMYTLETTAASYCASARDDGKPFHEILSWQTSVLQVDLCEHWYCEALVVSVSAQVVC